MISAIPPPFKNQTRLRRALGMYRIGAPFVAVLMVPNLLRRMIKRGGFKRNFGQRFGYFNPGDKRLLSTFKWTWIRSISVGETLVALKLARSLAVECPQIKIAISVTTSTGYELARKEAADNVFVFYNPVDTQSAVHKTLSQLRPERLILIEGEVWPNLMAACHERGIPVALANARLSKRSAKRFALFQRWVSPFFELLQWVGIPDEEDRERWVSLGVSSGRIIWTGSIKFDHGEPGASRSASFSKLLEPLHISQETPLLIAGSTHEGEEEILFRSLAMWRHDHPCLRLAIAPRHVERIPKLLRELAFYGWKIQLRNELPTTGSWDVLMLNTTGELRDWYPLATLVFVGKSLMTEGGQNPVEPALAGRAVLFGPHMENFETVVSMLLKADGAQQVQSELQLVESVSDLLKHPQRRQTMGCNALQCLSVHQGAAKRTALLVKEMR